MAINFPNSPVGGTTYTYLGITYTWKDTGGGTGLWQITTPGTYGVATVGEIDAGTDTVKYISPAGLQSSKYLSTDDEAAGITAGTTDEYVSPANIAASNLRQWTQYDGGGVSGKEVVLATFSGTGNQGTNRPFYIFGAKKALIRIYFNSDGGGGISDSFYIFPSGAAYTDFPFFHRIASVTAGTYPYFSELFEVPVPASGLMYARHTQWSTNVYTIYALGYWY